MNEQLSKLLLAIKGNYWASQQFDEGSESHSYYLGQAKKAKEELYTLLDTVG